MWYTITGHDHADSLARRSYELRASRSEPGLEGASEPQKLPSSVD